MAIMRYCRLRKAVLKEVSDEYEPSDNYAKQPERFFR